MKKISFIGAFTFLGLCITFLLMSWDPNVEEIPEIFKQHPPIPTEFWVQKLEQPNPEGELVLKVVYESDIKLPEQLQVFMGKGVALSLRDDGVFPDETALDYEFSSIISDDPIRFKEHYLSQQAAVLAKDYIMEFTGHLGRMTPTELLIKFDQEGFEQNKWVQLDPSVVNEPFCEEEDILKHKSLLITDLRVVEDPVRTYNVVDQTGNPTGAWTFGELMKNMAGGISDVTQEEDEQKVKDLLKQWLIGLINQFEYNGRFSEERSDAALISLVINPWLLKAYGEEEYFAMATIENWQSLWANADIGNLLKSAPFKLTAIVNRLDLRENITYTNNFNNSGETRFVFSLISTYNYGLNNNSDIIDFDDNLVFSNIGKPPFHLNTDNPQQQYLDWQGMNVILEYGNVESEKCDVKQKAQDWIALSELSLEDDLELYLDNLEDLTATVTVKNAAPDRINGSAINQVRTNEKILGVLLGQFNWNDANWELRQFELNEDGFLTNAPVSNVPFKDENIALNNSLTYTTPNNFTVPNWIYGVNQNSNITKVLHGNHSLPDQMLEPTAVLDDELMHYYEFDYWGFEPPTEFLDLFENFEESWTENSSYREKQIQRQLSLNTCQGCHGGETKTAFT